MKLSKTDELTGMLRVVDTERMLIISEYGYGKRVDFSEFTSHGRGTGGQRIYTVSDKTGEIVGCVSVLENEDIMCITSQGKSIKIKVKEVRVMGRTAQGVRLLSIDKPDFVIGLDRIVKEDSAVGDAVSDTAGDDTEDKPSDGEPEAQEQLDFDE
jgi:DNA gyrase subunit A